MTLRGEEERRDSATGDSGPRPDETVGELAARMPGAERVFERFGIDYCCGGRRTLADAAAGAGANCAAVIAALVECKPAADEEDATDWNTARLSDLADHIENFHHAYLKEELPELAGLADKVARVHGDAHPELREVKAVFNGLRAEMDAHMMKEEQILFPMIREIERSGGGDFHCGSIENPIRVMMMEHDSAGEALAAMNRLTGGYAIPEDACYSYRRLLAGLERLEKDMHRHVHKENNILFPRAVTREASPAV
jgi:regulator of cell morphogenesis and NO signaling